MFHTLITSHQHERTLCLDWYKQSGCQHQPLLRIPLDNIIIDELHLMLRVRDQLETGPILKVLHWDEVESLIYSLSKFCLEPKLPTH